MDTCQNVLQSNTSLFEQFQKFIEIYEQFEIFLNMLKQLKNFQAFRPHAMSTLSNKCFASSFCKWISDSSATHHMSYIMSQFILLNLNSSKSVVTANGDSMALAGIGSVDTPCVALSDVYYIPSLTINLASISKIYDSGCDVNFSVSDSLGKLDTHDIFDYSCCKLAKFSAQPFSISISSSTALFDLVHSDVWGPAPVSTKGGSRYYVSFIDDFARYTWVYMMKHMSDFLIVFKEFRALDE
ncbi:gag-pol polyprotein, partial [Tanacetum coccineum]